VQVRKALVDDLNNKLGIDAVLGQFLWSHLLMAIIK